MFFSGMQRAIESARASTHSPCQGENFLFKTECWVEWCCYCFNFCFGCRQCVVSYNSQRKCDNRRCTYRHLRHYPCVHLHVSLAIITRNHVDTSLAKVLNKSYLCFFRSVVPFISNLFSKYGKNWSEYDKIAERKTQQRLTFWYIWCSHLFPVT